MLPTVEWRDDRVVMIDQRKLPGQEVYVECRTAHDVARAIERMVIRGAPAIGVAAAMGLALGVTRARAQGTSTLAREFYRRRPARGDPAEPSTSWADREVASTTRTSLPAAPSATTAQRCSRKRGAC